MSSELKIKLGVDLSEVDAAASEIPDKIERAARKQRRPAMKPLRVWDEVAGKWVPATDRQNPQIPGGPANRGAPSPSGYRMPIGPGLPGVPGGGLLPAAQASRQYNTPIGPGMAGMPGGQYVQPSAQPGQQSWADRFRDKLMKALEQSVLRMVVPVHLINRFTNFIVTTITQAFDRAQESLRASRATGETVTTTMKLGQLGERMGVERSEMFAILEEAKQRLGKGTFRGGEAVMALQRLGFTIQEVRNGSINSVDVLKRLADQYKKTGANAQLAAIGADIFGSNFQKLAPLLQNGAKGIEDAMGKMDTMEEGTVRALNEVMMIWKSFIETLQALTFDLLLLIPRIVSELDDSLRLARAMGLSDVETKEEATKVLEEISQQADRWGTGMRAPGESMEAFLGRFERDYLLNERSVDMEDDEKKIMLEALKDMRATLRPDIITQGSLPMATSLQAMGGGDILSAIQRNPMEEVARNTAQTAINTGIIANNTPGSQPQPQPIVGP